MEDMKHKFSDLIKKYDYVVVTQDHQWDYYPNCYKPNNF
jgi:uncharacterized protein YutD